MADKNPIWNVLTVAPTLRDSPAVAVSLAQAGAQPAQIETVGAMDYTMRMQKYLTNLPDDLQRSAYSDLNDAQRTLLAGIKYEPPAEHHGSRFGHLFRNVVASLPGINMLPFAAQQTAEHTPDVIAEPVGAAISATGQKVGAGVGAVGHYIGQGLEYSAVPLHQVQRGYRATQQLGMPSWLPYAPVAGGIGVYTMLKGAGEHLDPQDWVNAWRDAGDPAKDYAPDALAETRSKYDPVTFTLAKRVADGEHPTDIVAALGDPTAQENAYLTMQTEEFGRAVRDLNGAHLSFGRSIARDLGIDPGDKAFMPVSGTFDALSDIGFDPTLALGKVTRGVQAARFGIHAGLDAADTERRVATLFEKPSVTRYWDNVTQHVATLTSQTASREAKGAASRALRRGLNAGPMVDGLVKNNVTSVDAAQAWLKDGHNLAHILRGKSGVSRPLMPHLSKAGETLLNDRAKWGSPIDWLEAGGRFVADDDPTLVGKQIQAGREGAHGYTTFRARAARTLTRLTAQVPETQGGHLFLNDENAPEQVFRLARMFAPAWYSHQMAAAFTAADTQGRQDIIIGIFKTIGEAGGLTQSAEGTRFLERLTKERLGGSSVFSPAGADIMPSGRRVAVRSSQLREYVTLPTFQDMYAEAGRTAVLGRIVGGHTPHLDYTTNNMFKRAVLLRPALALRNGGEEDIRHIIDQGIGSLAKGHLVRRILDPEAGRVFRAFTNGLTTATLPAKVLGPGPKEAARTAIRTPHDWFVAHVTDKIRRLTNKVGLDDSEVGWIDDLKDNPTAMNGFYRETFDSAGKSIRMADEGEVLAKAKSRGGRTRHMQLRPNGDFDVRRSEGLKGAMAWAYQLTDIAETPEGRVALTHILDGQPRDTAVREIAELIESPGFEKHRLASQAYKELGADGWAERMYDDAALHVHTPDGQLIPEVAAMLRGEKGKITSRNIAANLLNDIDETARPTHLVSRDYLAIDNAGNLISQMANTGFDLIGDLTNYLSRQPITSVNYLKARAQLQPAEKLVAAKLGEAEAKRWATEHAMETALLRTLSYVDNTEVRSQTAVIMRNLFPFWRAQEEFYRRWARTFRHSPEAFRRLALINEGAHHSGFVTKDDQGNDVFVYPGSGQMQATMAKVGGLFGLNLAQLPVHYELQSQVRFLNQGLDPKNITPSGGPLLAIPLAALQQAFPGTWTPIEHAIQGDVGSGRGVTEAVMSGFIPTPLRRAIRYGVIPGINSDDEKGQLASTTRQAIAAAEAAGLTPPADATPAQVDAYQRYVKNWARQTLALRVVFGAFAPASPEQGDFAPKTSEAFRGEGIASIKDEYYALVRKVGFDRARVLYMKAHPDGSPFIQSQSESPSGAVVPATAKAYDYYTANRAFFDSHPDIAPFFLPQEQGDFNQNAYQIELADGLRQTIPVDEFYQDIKVSGQLGFYFDQRDTYEAAVTAAREAGDRDRVAQLTGTWSAWKTQFLNVNPLVADYMSEAGVRQRDRDKKIEGLRRATAANALPAGPTADLFADIITAWDNHRRFQDEHAASLPGGRTDVQTGMRAQEKAGFDLWLQSRIGTDPNGLMLYNKIFRYAEA